MIEALTRFPEPEQCVYCDLETDGLLLSDVTQVHTLCLNFPSGYEIRYSTLPEDIRRGHTIQAGLKFLKTLIEERHLVPVWHNGAGYDLGVLHKLYPDVKQWMTIDNTIDSFLMSCITWPDRALGHSLESYGTEEESKVANEDWSVVTEHMVQRCLSDTRLTKIAYCYLYDRLVSQGHLDRMFKPLTLESAVAHIHQKQMDHGVCYDLTTALTHWNYLSQECLKLEEQILQEAPWKTRITGIPLKSQESERYLGETLEAACAIKTVEPFKINGDYKKTVVGFWGQGEVHKVKGPYVKIECLPLNLNNSEEVKDFLKSLGWKPTEWNYTFKDGRKVRTSPKLTEDSYGSLPEGLGKQIAKYRTYQHRARSILNRNEKTGEVKGAVSTIRGDGRVTAEALTCGTPTARYRHMGTICNPPRPSSLFGKEVRETFYVPEDHWQIGIDLLGIEARMLAHFLRPYKGSQPIIDAILADKASGVDDFHTRNAKMWGVSRDTAKSGLYALMYGCYPKKLAETLGYPEAKGQQLHDDFWSFNEPIRLLVEDLESSYDINGGWITGLDGRPLFVREKRKLLNTLLQNAATMVFKKWMIYCDEVIRRWGAFGQVKVRQIIAYHDELQFEAYTDNKHTATSAAYYLAKEALRAGEYFNIAVPTPAEYKIGKSWADCH